ncbi:hypothetical protein [Streptomyces sp. CT34]|uniref:HalD/BesD family halogenase n=1 Tax=Streptomyces sp. CT34 TaxID=1553907 RepID=UPI00068A812B|nr:hypothetical protein [Streptomyces sp. CT34]
MLCLPTYTPALRGRFAADGYLPLPGLIRPDLLRALHDETRRLEKLAIRRDFAMESMADSPRRMTILGGQIIAAESALIPRLYGDAELIGLIGRIAQLPTVPVRDPVERYVLNILHREGDTHGAHTDDYPLALVLFVEAPLDREGDGLLEYVRHTTDLHAWGTRAVRCAHHCPGDAYLLRSDTTAHRVTPLNRPGLRRTVLNFAYTTPARQQARTDSAARLYTPENQPPGGNAP